MAEERFFAIQKGGEEMFAVETIELQYNAKNTEDVLKRLGQLLYSHNFVKDTYLKGILEREKVYPTGLPSRGIPIAIPHTDPIHVKKSQIAVMTLENPVSFSMMGDPEVTLPVQIVFMLAIKDPKQQLQLLKQLMKVFQDEKLLQEILASQDKEHLKTLLSQNLFTREAV